MKKLFSIITLLMCIFISCQNEFSIENNTDNIQTSTPNDSIYIKKLIALDTTKTAPFDTVYISTFNYDNFKRLEKYSFLEYNNLGFIDTTNFYYFNTRFYNSINDTLPSKENFINKDNLNTSIGTRFFTYYSGTTLIQIDSSIETIQTQPLDIYTTVFKYFRFTNSIKIIQTNYFNTIPQSLDSLNYVFTKQNGNIITQQESIYGITNSYNCQYDTKNNPLSKSKLIFNQGFLDLLLTDTDPTFYNQPNNVTQINNIYGASNSNYKFIYKYNSLNYPSEVNLKNLSGGPLFKGINKIIYQYTN
ncbi:hypothetical protein ACFOWM_13840 [Ferruginibacter yonginensis]|uniref:YD repeat-containing protein n=1 Tax=Ferruginibacter yonginensis TaxID=1310416 RepID=A0ABV8QUV0_9BACT